MNRLIQMLTLLALAGLFAGSPALAQTAEPDATNGDNPGQRFVQFQTSAGDFVVELFREQAPVSTANFVQYVEAGFYDGTIFHRVIGDFVIQGGGYTTDLKKKPTGEPIVNEADNMLANDFGTLAMARTAHPHSATSQFYINVADNSALNHTGKTNSRAWGYAVFGRVVSGLDTIETIRAVTTGPAGPFPRDVPTEPVVIQAATLVDGPESTTETAAPAVQESTQP